MDRQTNLKRKAEEDDQGKETTKESRAAPTPKPTHNKTAVATRTKPANMEEEGAPGSPGSRAELLKGMKGMLKEMTEALSTKLSGDIEKAVGAMGISVNKNTINIAAMREEMIDMRRRGSESEAKIMEKIGSLQETVTKIRSGSESSFFQNVAAGSEGGPPRSPRSKQYEVSRRSLRLCPVRGVEEAEIRNETVRFLRQKLRVLDTELNEEQITRIRRMRAACSMSEIWSLPMQETWPTTEMMREDRRPVSAWTTHHT